MNEAVTAPVGGCSLSQGERLAAFVTIAESWIARSVNEAARAWFRKAIDDVNGGSDRALGMAISLASRRLGRARLALDAADLARADDLRPGFSPRNWSIDQLARVALMAANWRDDAVFAQTIDHLSATAELNELIALCLGFAIYPVGAPIEPRAREAIRSGIKPVFEAIAHHNPYPSEVFAEDDWNQMVVKAVFNSSALWPIQGLDRRGNPDLSRMLVALAHERRAAGRPISAEIWRCVVPHADEEGRDAIVQAWQSEDDRHRIALVRALTAVPALLSNLPFEGELREIQAKLASEIGAQSS